MKSKEWDSPVVGLHIPYPTKDTLYGKHIMDVTYDIRRCGWMVRLESPMDGWETVFLSDERVATDPDLLRMIQRANSSARAQRYHVGSVIHRADQLVTFTETYAATIKATYKTRDVDLGTDGDGVASLRARSSWVRSSVAGQRSYSVSPFWPSQGP